MTTLSEKDAHLADGILSQLKTTPYSVHLAIQCGNLGRARQLVTHCRQELDALETILKAYED